MKLGDMTEVVRSNRATPSLVADVLREAIVRGVLREGVQLRQDALATEFGVSRIPIREALRKLEAEGLVTMQPNRGAVVAELSGEEVQEIYEIRILLESAILRLALPQMSTELLRRAEKILDTIDAEEDAVRWIDLNREFHLTLYAPANKPRLLQLINTLRANVDRYVNLYISLLDRRSDAQQEHREILKACRRRDQDDAVRALERHLSRVAEGISAYLQKETRRNWTPLRSIVPYSSGASSGS